MSSITRLTSAAWLREEDNLRCHLGGIEALLVVNFVEGLVSMSHNGMASMFILTEGRILPPAWVLKRVAFEGNDLIFGAE